MAQGFQFQITNATDSSLTIGATPFGFTTVTKPPTTIAQASTSGLLYFEVSDGTANLALSYGVIGQDSANNGLVNLSFDSASTHALNGTIYMYQFVPASVNDATGVSFVYPYTLLFQIGQAGWPFLCVEFVPVVGRTLTPSQFLPSLS